MLSYSRVPTVTMLVRKWHDARTNAATQRADFEAQSNPVEPTKRADWTAWVQRYEKNPLKEKDPYINDEAGEYPFRLTSFMSRHTYRDPISALCH